MAVTRTVSVAGAFIPGQHTFARERLRAICWRANTEEKTMSQPIDMTVIGETNCSFDATARIPKSGALLSGIAKGTNSSDGNWTAIALSVTELDTGAIYHITARSDTEQVDVPLVVRNPGLYRIHAVQSNFRETCEYTRVGGRSLEPLFFD